MPGMAANPKIFEYIKFAEDQFEVHLLDWKIPGKNESLEDYSERIAEDVTEPNPVLIGVSFGGVIVQEISKILNTARVIIISSIKSKDELPPRLKFLGRTGMDRILPTFLAPFAADLHKYPTGRRIRKRAELYHRYMSNTDKNYLDWSIHNLVNWRQEDPLQGVIHIHGDRDIILPIKNIDGCILVKGGTHVMIVDRFRWFNENLPKLILNGIANAKID